MASLKPKEEKTQETEKLEKEYQPLTQAPTLFARNTKLILKHIYWVRLQPNTMRPRAYANLIANKAAVDESPIHHQTEGRRAEATRLRDSICINVAEFNANSKLDYMKFYIYSLV